MSNVQRFSFVIISMLLLINCMLLDLGLPIFDIVLFNTSVILTVDRLLL